MAQYINKDTYVGNTGKQLKDIKTNADNISINANNISSNTNKINAINKRLSNVCLHSGAGPTSFTVHGGPYATILVISMYYVGIIALNNGGQNVHNIYGGIPNLTFTWINSTTIQISGFESWNHHIFIGSSTIDQIISN